MNDFGEMSITGAVLSNTEMRELRMKRGECESCGQKCFKKSLFKQTPLTIHGRVLNGRCLNCHPLEADELEFLPAEVNLASSRDVARATQSAPWSSTGNLYEVNHAADNENHHPVFFSNRDINASHRTMNSDFDYSRRSQLTNMASSKDFVRGPIDEASSTIEKENERSNNPEPSSLPTSESNQHFNPRNFFQKRGLGKKQSSGEISEHSTQSPPRRGFFSLSTSKKSWGSQSSVGSNRSTNNKNAVFGESKRSLVESQQLKALEELNDSSSIEDILLTAATFPQNKAIQEKAMHLLANLTYNVTASELDRLQRQMDDIRIVMEVMETFPSEQKLQFDCCSILRNLCISSDIQSFIAQNGAINCIINCMESFSENVFLQQSAIQALTKIGQNDESLLTILKGGGPKRIVEAMVNHNENFDIIDLSCASIIKLAAEDYSFKTIIVDKGGADQIIFAMVVFSNDAELLKKCFAALRILCVGHDGNKREIVEKGAVDSIVSMMQLYKDETEIQEYGASTLYELGSIPETSSIIGNSGGIDMLVRALWLHSENKYVKLECCRTLEALSFNIENLSLMFDIGVIPAVINTMQETTEICSVQAMSCSILANLAGTSRKEVKVSIVEEEALDAISIAMVLHKNVGTLQHNACRVLSNLICDENLDAIQAANAPELMNVAAFNFPSECDTAARTMVQALESASRI